MITTQSAITESASGEMLRGGTEALRAATAPNRARLIAGLAFAMLLTNHAANGVQAPVGLGTAGNYVILAKTGISTVPPSVVT
jgi:hypothetical protein